MLAALIVYTSLPTIPIILNALKPLNVSRPLLFILNGEFLINKTEHYSKIFIFDFICGSSATCIILSVDTMYAVCTEHCVGLFAIIKYRFEKLTRFTYIENKSNFKIEDASYDWMIETIQLHKDVLKFANILENCFSPIFLVILGLNTLYFSLLSVLVLISFNKPLNLVRYTMLLVALFIHLFYLSWPGQKLIDHSEGLFNDAYLNEWYEISIKSKNLLRFFRQRCQHPCSITAGGLYVMNFENFLKLMKKSVSFITVFTSLR